MARGDRFSTTRWSVILKAGSLDEAESRDALATLCQAYWSPVYAYVRRRGSDPDAARDLTQSFFAMLLERRGIADARRERGRFRSFLLTAVKNFLIDEHDHDSAQKRGSGHAPISIDTAEWESTRAAMEPRTDLTPETSFERQWAMAVLEQAMDELRREMKGSGGLARWDALKDYLVHDADPPYEELAAGLGMNEPAVRVALHRMRRRFGAVLRGHVEMTVEDPAKTDDELRYLVGLLGS